MKATELLERVRAAGVRLAALPGGRLWAEPSALLTDELRSEIRAHRAELLTLLARLPKDASASLEAAVEERRHRVLAELGRRPGARYAAVVDESGASGPVVVAIAIRGVGTCEVTIPCEKWDPFLFFEFLDRHCDASSVH